MKELEIAVQEATEKICALKGNVIALEAVIAALLKTLPSELRPAFSKNLISEQEAATAVLLGASVSDVTVEAFAHDVQRVLAIASAQSR